MFLLKVDKKGNLMLKCNRYYHLLNQIKIEKD